MSSTTESATTWVLNPSGVAGNTVSMPPASMSPGRTSRRSPVISRTPVDQPVTNSASRGFLMSPPSGTIASAPSASTDSPSTRCSSERRGRPVIAMPSVSTAAVVARASGVERPLCRSWTVSSSVMSSLAHRIAPIPNPNSDNAIVTPSTGVNHVYDFELMLYCQGSTT
jgi:hypothetical protein